MNREQAKSLRSLLNSGKPLSGREAELAEQMASRLESTLLWKPFPGPQRKAYLCDADELFFGGAAGGGKSQVLLGLAVTRHQRSLFLRRESVQLTAAVDDLKKIVGSRGQWRSSGHGGTMRIQDGKVERVIELCGCELEDDKEKYQGRPHDLYAFDEVSHFSRTQYRFISGWNRTDDPRQRCRVVAAGNPPTTPEGRWVVEEWEPWLGVRFHDPAEPGELRWFTYLDGLLTWLPEGEPIVHRGERIVPRSRTFIPARVQDNPIYMATGYLATLQALPEPMRSQFLYGDFSAGTEDNEWQVIPTAWVLAAQARWREHPQPPEGQALSCLGADVAYGGADSTCVSPRYGPWFGEIRKYQGSITDSGPKAAYLVLNEHDGRSPVHVDSIGYGAPCLESLRDRIGHLAIGVNFSESTNLYDRTGRYRLTNKRTAAYWKLREALDPDHGDNLMLPPDPELLADLTAPRFEVRSSGIVVEPKEALKARIGRSPDKGDAVCLAHFQPSLLGVPSSIPNPVYRPTTRPLTYGPEYAEGRQGGITFGPPAIARSRNPYGPPDR